MYAYLLVKQEFGGILIAPAARDLVRNDPIARKARGHGRIGLQIVDLTALNRLSIRLGHISRFRFLFCRVSEPAGDSN